MTRTAKVPLRFALTKALECKPPGRGGRVCRAGEGRRAAIATWRLIHVHDDGWTRYVCDYHAALYPQILEKADA